MPELGQRGRIPVGEPRLRISPREETSAGVGLPGFESRPPHHVYFFRSSLNAVRSYSSSIAMINSVISKL